MSEEFGNTVGSSRFIELFFLNIDIWIFCLSPYTNIVALFIPCPLPSL